ncbi:MAG TPA: J domain-containing protein, partial [Candidatus Sumerlaeota bacterium]|nr:J domain-containing protein [Candidatus Sumerlaeota bacterium]
MTTESNPYSILNLSKNVTDQDIKKAYFDLVKKYDPERHTEQFMVLQNAYKRLKDPQSRAREDIYIFNSVKGEFIFTDEEKNPPPEENLRHQITKMEEEYRKNSSSAEVRTQIIQAYMQRSFLAVKKRLWA